MTKRFKIIFVGFIALLLAFVIMVPTVLRVSALEAKAVDKQGDDSALLAKNARAATLLDYDTGTVVFDKNAKEHYPIASMVKIMTLNCIFDAINNGELSIDTDVTVSENAASMGGSQAFLDANSVYKTGELIKSIVVASANDSCVALAEHIAGSVEAFVDKMNSNVEALGLKDTNFVNCTGLPASGAYSCAHDVGVMTRSLIKNSQFFDYAKVWMYDIVHPSGRTTALSNTNKLIRGYNGCDGGKTGFTNEAMYCLSATAKRGNTRLIAVTMGERDSKVRNFETSSLLNFGFANYETKKLIDSNKSLDEVVPISKGKIEELKVAPKQDYFVFGKKGSKDKINNEVTLDSVKAPVKQGDKVGEIRVYSGDKTIATIDVIATMDIDECSYFDLLSKVLRKW